MTKQDMSARQFARISSHLREEEQLLATLLMAAREIRQALRKRDGESLSQALEFESNTIRSAETVFQKRKNLRTEMSQCLNVDPCEVTLSGIEELLAEEDRRELRKCRDRLQQMSDELLRINRQNSAMIQQTLDLTQRIVGELTGGGPHFTSYSATGQSESPQLGPVLQWGG